MKKFATILVLLFVLSVSAFAEGEIPASGKSCPQGQQTCLTDGEIPASGKSCPQGQTCLTDGQIPASGKSDNTIINTVLDFLKSIFG